ncbi:sulfatase family protein [Stratiformator vulcanicus]|uniref:Arylsulfatase n=1 Tax=Stratiformator vulcanicus TaxID=2527980 RepID=A0A517R6U2_9PLAN|nr:sulfatase-like hydrolase/transferase [Stratiformator vulcanicus]QDT39617.1 Arylsulfatase precursor [Stratiformator vulcanicus]
MFQHLLCAVAILCLSTQILVAADDVPHIVLVMADDQGWGETSYYDHPVLKTPQLDAMAASGLRFDRFYAGAPVCSPTRATVLTGRTNDRTGVLSHGYALRTQEKTLAQALKAAGYATGHFGKWHLDGFRGPGVPILKDDPRSPGVFGFDTWLSVTNFFDRDPVMSREGKFEQFRGDSSEIIVAEALKFIQQKVESGRPTFSVIWYGSPHAPFLATEEDREGFDDLNSNSQHHYGEIVAIDRSVGTLRQGLRDLGIATNTLLWYCSDNGGLENGHGWNGKSSVIRPDTVGGLRDNKGSVYEGGLRVPCIVEWPAVIDEERTTDIAAATQDIFPTIADIVGLPSSAMLNPIDGVSLAPLFRGEPMQRSKPIGFRFGGRGAWVDGDWKLVATRIAKNRFELYHLADDPTESNNLIDINRVKAEELKNSFLAWNASVEKSFAGADYPAGKLAPADLKPRGWVNAKEYKPYLEDWQNRPEYAGRIKRELRRKSE